MTDLEFDIIDELYFVVHYSDLEKQLTASKEEIKQTLYNLVDKGWIKCFESHDNEIYDVKANFMEKYHQYYYLATKEGLKMHNGL